MLNRCFKLLRNVRSVRQMSYQTEEVIQLRDKYLSPVLRTFQAYNDPLVLDRGSGQYLWDSKGNKYVDLLGQNLCISVGYGHPKIIKAAVDQMNKLSHCNCLLYLSIS